MSYSVSGLFKSTVSHYLTALSGVLEKGAAAAEAGGYEEAALLTDRLYPDMFALTLQVQIACDLAVRGGGRLAGVEPKSIPNEETTFAELQARINVSKDYVAGLSDADLDAGFDRDVEIPTGPDSSIKMNGGDYLTGFFLPNFYFHLATAYGLLRKNGVPVGKMDFLGRT